MNDDDDDYSAKKACSRRGASGILYEQVCTQLRTIYDLLPSSATLFVPPAAAKRNQWR